MHRSALQLGGFHLHRAIGRGGMGEVWSAQHQSGVPVAVKILRADGDLRTFVRLFENEVRAVAGLTHPHIVRVHDYGQIEDDRIARELQAPRLAPYLVMELASGGTLRGLRARLDWPTLRRVLEQLLDALAHAHARGVVHRDIKAANILLDARTGRAILSDFGLAHLGEDLAIDAASKSGTPSHMAPEQFAGAWRDFGPWTDLYGLGAVTWSLITGQPPYGRRRAWTEAARLHQSAPLPPLRARFPVPPGVEAWLHALLRKDPGERLGRAADARAMLAEVGGAVGRGSPLPVGIDHDSETISTQPDLDLEAPPAVACPAPPPRPPVLPDWRELAEVAEAGEAMAGVGLGLFGLRAIPLVDREQARDALWSAAREVLEQGEARAVLLRGAAGCGKSRLASWLGETLEAIGVGLALHMENGPTDGPLDGVGPMIERWLHAQALPTAERLVRAEQALRRLGATDSHEWHALVELIEPGAAGVEVRLRSARERHQVIRHWLGRIADTGRIVVLWLDDLQWGRDAIQLAVRVLVARGLRVLVIGTVREEALVERPEAASLLAALEAHERAHTVEVGPLEAADRQLLVERLLGLSGPLAADVAERTGGNPLFAVQLVGDWVGRGLLEPAAGGFRLREGARVAVPDDVHEVWSARLDRLLEGRHPDDRAALELASVLGQRVDGAEWRAACAAAGVRPSSRLVPLLVRQRLARSDDPEVEWGFVHGMLRESLERQVRDGGRWARRNSEVADALASLARPGRVGLHLLEAGRLEEAVEPLIEGTLAAFRWGDQREMERLVVRAEHALDGIGAPPHDRRRILLLLRRAEADSVAGRVDIARRRARAAGELAAQAGADDLRATALMAESQGWLLRREVERAGALLERGLALVDRVHPGVEARLRTGLAALAHGSGRHAEVHAHLDRALAVFEAIDDIDGIGRCRSLLGASWAQVGDHQKARELFQGAIDAYRQVGARLGQAVAYNGLAMAEFDEGRPEAARPLMEQCIALARASGSDAGITAGMDLGTIVLGCGEIEEARAIFEETIAGLARTGQRVRGHQCNARLLHPLALLEDRAAYEQALAEARPLLTTDAYTVHGAMHLTEAAKRVTALGWSDEARKTWALARHQWSGLGREDRVREADAALA